MPPFLRPGGSRARWILLLAWLPAAGLWGQQPRRIALRLAEPLLSGPEAVRLRGWARRSGAELDVASVSTPVPPGSEGVFVAGLPPPDPVRRLVARFPLRIEAAGFVFDGRAYRGPEDAIALTDPARPSLTVVLGNGAHGALRLAMRRLFWREGAAPDYEVAAGELTKEGRFTAGASALTIDRPSDRDEIAAQDQFLKSFRTEERDGILWRCREADRPAVARWEPVLRRFLFGKRALRILVRFFPDPAAKARSTGSSRPADLSREGSEIFVDIDLSAPTAPDCVTPVLASAAFAAEDPRLLSRPVLLAALGARASGRWWGRDVRGFGAFVRAAKVEPTAEQVVRADEEVSPLLAVGAAASWLDAGARADGEEAVRRALSADDAECARQLARWAARAAAEPVTFPARRPVAAGFFRGISYAMTNSISGGYASPRSKETLAHLARLSVNAVSVMPFAFSPNAHDPHITFVHRSPQGETDEGTVRAVADARALGMTAMVKPQIWVPGAFVGEVSMGSEVEWRRWFDSYRRFLVHNAVVAEASGAAILCVGTELVATESHHKEWLDTVAAIRLATGAALTYASNWASGAPRIAFWDALDAIGVDFYDALSKDLNASDAELEAGVRRAAAPLPELARRTGKPILFTEAGYPPVRGAWMEPHDENTGRPPAPADAARSIAAVFRALDGQAWWKGVYWWKAFSDGRAARPDERGYNVLGSPVEGAIADGFARMAGEKRASR